MGKRRHISLKTKLEAALLQLGLDPRNVRLDHHPALELRPFEVVDGIKVYTPAYDDPRYLQWMSTQAHLEKTTGRRGESKLSLRDGDLARINKVKRIVKRLAARSEPSEPKRKHKWPTRPFSTRGSKPMRKPWPRRT